MSGNASFPGVVLPGSVLLSTAEDAFRWAGENYGPWLRRVSDGETGERSHWIQSQTKQFEENPTLALAEPNPARPFGRAMLKEGVEPAFDRFGYADWAKTSYEAFARARDAGVLPKGIRLMVAMPHPMDTCWIMCQADAFGQIYPAYEAQALASVREVTDAIPHGDLTIQWDMPLASLVWADSAPNLFASKQDMLDAVVRTAEVVAPDVELGFHLCYGDRTPPVFTGDAPELAGANEALKVVYERPDASSLASLVNELAKTVSRPIAYFHLPTDAGWLEPHHYESLKDLKIAPGTEMHVGVVALRVDGNLPVEEGVIRSRQRANAARSVLGNVGLSSSCGLGRHTPEQFEAATTLIRELAQEAAR